MFPLDEKKVIGKTMLGESIYYVEEGYFEWMLTNKVIHLLVRKTRS